MIFKKFKCKHDYYYVDTVTPHMLFSALQKEKEYIFKCSRCGKVKIIHNYHVITKVQKKFMKLINKELSKKPKERMSNKVFMEVLWNQYSKYSNINNSLREKINVSPLNLRRKEIQNVTEEDILALKFIVDGAKISTGFLELDKRLSSGTSYIIAKKRFGKKYCAIDEMRFIVDLERKEKDIKDNYLYKGIEKDKKYIRQAAIKKIIRSEGVVYKTKNEEVIENE